MSRVFFNLNKICPHCGEENFSLKLRCSNSNCLMLLPSLKEIEYRIGEHRFAPEQIKRYKEIKGYFKNFPSTENKLHDAAKDIAEGIGSSGLDFHYISLYMTYLLCFKQYDDVMEYLDLMAYKFKNGTFLDLFPLGDAVGSLHAANWRKLKEFKLPHFFSSPTKRAEKAFLLDRDSQLSDLMKIINNFRRSETDPMYNLIKTVNKGLRGFDEIKDLTIEERVVDPPTPVEINENFWFHSSKGICGLIYNRDFINLRRRYEVLQNLDLSDRFQRLNRELVILCETLLENEDSLMPRLNELC